MGAHYLDCCDYRFIYILTSTWNTTSGQLKRKLVFQGEVNRKKIPLFIKCGINGLPELPISGCIPDKTTEGAIMGTSSFSFLPPICEKIA